MQPHIAYIIPARIQSVRLPQKPLVDILGTPMVLRTWRQTVQAAGDARAVYIATDDARIADVCMAGGAQVIMTSPNCLTGTDRVAEAAKYIKADIFINVQGDEPLMPPSDIVAVAEAARTAPDSIINGWCWIENEAMFRSPSVPKVIIAQDGRLLYMSRGPVPASKDGAFHFARRQVCVYAFPRAALDAFASVSAKAEHEQIEDIEILRLLEMGFEVRMIELSAHSIAVDTPADLERVRAAVVKLEAEIRGC